MTSSSYLLNTYSSVSLTVDPTSSDYSLRAFSLSDAPLAFTFTTIASTNLFKICTTSLPMLYCLDVYGDQKYTPHLARPGDYSGQQWSVVTFETGFKLSNEYTGSGWFLDVYADTKVAHMTQGDYQGQYWVRVDASSKASSNVFDVPSPTTARLDDATHTSTLPMLSDQTRPSKPTTTTSPVQSITSAIVGLPDPTASSAASSSPALSTGPKKKVRVMYALPAVAATVLVCSLLL